MNNACHELFQRQRQCFDHRLRFVTWRERMKKLRRLRQWIQVHQTAIERAIYQDFRKPAAEVALTDIKPVLSEIREARLNLQDWVRPRRVSSPLYLVTVNARVEVEPKGVSLILAPWNFPFMLSIGPLVSAIAAGNCVVLKPSEMAPHTAELIQGMVAELFTPEEIATVLGDATVAADLLKLPFDHIFFTGSPEVGKLVMQAAAANLTSVTLELGGRNAAIVDETADLSDTAEKLIWGKFLNNGQSCVSPNYVLVDRRVQAALVEALRDALGRLYESDPGRMARSPHYARIINSRHFDRVKRLLNDSVKAGAVVVAGGVTRSEDNYIAPTLLDQVPRNAPVMQEEIFGPILPIVEYETLDDAIAVVRTKDKPLALYVFSRSRANVRRVLQSTSSGAVCVNETTLHFIHPDLPFGGVNHSGIGKAHGHAGFMAFTNVRPVLEQRRGFTTVKMVYPPYTALKKTLIHILTWWL